MLEPGRAQSVGANGMDPAVGSSADPAAELQAANRRITHQNAILRAISHINQLIVREQDAEVLLQQACRSLVETRSYTMTWAAMLVDGRARLVAQAGLAEEFDAVQQDLVQGRLPGCAQRALTNGGGVVPTVGRARLCDRCPLLGREPDGSGLAVRLEHAGRVYGVLSVHLSAGQEFEAEELPLLEELGGDIALALHKITVEHERRQLEEQYLQAQKMEAIGRLAGGVAHDFRNQLTVIDGYCQLLLGDMPEDHPLRKPLQEIHKAAQRSTRLTSQLLVFSRRQVLHPERLNFNPILGELEPTVARILGEDVVLKLDLAEDLSDVQVDRAQLEQAIMNLVVNSRDAMPGGGTLTIQTRNILFQPGADYLGTPALHGSFSALCLSDTGTGMDEATRQRIFEPFFTTKPREKGTGLGLSMIYNFIRQSGGQIFVRSELNRGTTFELCVPQAQVAQPSPQAPAPPATVVVAEEELPVRRLICRVLRDRGYSVIEADNNASAAQVVHESREPINLLIASLAQGLTPEDFADRLRADHPEMQLLCLSAYAEEPAPLPRRKKGIHLLSKPFSLSRLTDTVRTVLHEPAGKPAKP